MDMPSGVQAVITTLAGTPVTLWTHTSTICRVLTADHHQQYQQGTGHSTLPASSWVLVPPSLPWSTHVSSAGRSAFIHHLYPHCTLSFKANIYFLSYFTCFTCKLQMTSNSVSITKANRNVTLNIPRETKFNLNYIFKFSSYRVVNTLLLRYKNKSHFFLRSTQNI